jgi:hypothetical protein
MNKNSDDYNNNMNNDDLVVKILIYACKNSRESTKLLSSSSNILNTLSVSKLRTFSVIFNWAIYELK